MGIIVSVEPRRTTGSAKGSHHVESSTEHGERVSGTGTICQRHERQLIASKEGHLNGQLTRQAIYRGMF